MDRGTIQNLWCKKSTIVYCFLSPFSLRNSFLHTITDDGVDLP